MRQKKAHGLTEERIRQIVQEEVAKLQAAEAMEPCGLIKPKKPD